MRNHDGLLVGMITNGPFAENCYLAADAATKQGILIDPGDEPDLILEQIAKNEIEVIEILCTHGHIDHAGAVAPLKKSLGVPFAAHPAERLYLEHLPQSAMLFGLPPKEVPTIDRELVPGEEFPLAGLTVKVLFTPGHTLGGCCLLFPAQKVVFVGDTLFAGSVGRTDLPGGDTATLLKAIQDQLFTLDDDVVAYTGHGPPTLIGEEKRSNPFLRPGVTFL